MAKQNQSDQLDRIVEAILARADGSLAGVSARMMPQGRVAFALRGLPRESFRATLLEDLKRRADMASTGVKPVREGFHTITPYIIVPGAAGLIDFMKKAFDATEMFRVARPGTSLIMHAEVRIGDSMVELADATDQYPPSSASIHLYVKDVDRIYSQAIEAGAKSLHGVVNQPYGDREGSVEDPTGTHWHIATHLEGAHVPPGMRTVTPYLVVRGADRLMDFVKSAFEGEQIERHLGPEGIIVHGTMKIGDSMLEMSEAHGEWGPRPSTIHLYVPNTDELYARALEAGATSIQPPTDQPYGDRSAGVTDEFGNRWFVATHIRDVMP
jgi:PhnB protein